MSATRRVLAILLVPVVGAAFAKSRLPLKEDADEDIFQPQPGCIFGGEFYDLEQKWHPVLDSEVMYCTQCTCNPIAVRGQVQQNGSVSCRRIANDCPDVSKCSETPVLPPNSCCKVCPENGEYYALLTGSFSTDALSDAVAVVHLSLQKTVMHITVDMTRNVQPRTIRVVDGQHRGRILFEHHIARDNQNSRVCAIWLSAFEHHAALRTPRQLSVVLTTRAHPGGELKGSIEKIPSSVAQASFVGLLMAPSLGGYGGVVWLSIQHTSERATLHVQGAVEVGSDEGSPTVLSMEILRDDSVIEKAAAVAITESGRCKFGYASQEMTRHTLKRLVQGRVSLVVQTKSGSRLQGTLRAWHQCGVLQALLTGVDAVGHAETGTAGLAKVMVSDNGLMAYQVQLQKFDKKVTGIIAETMRPSGAASKTLRLPMDGLANSTLVMGTHELADAREFQLFVEGRVHIAVETKEQGVPASLLRGQLQLITLGITAAKDGFETILLTSTTSAAAAAATCVSTRDCFLLCKVVLPIQVIGSSSAADVYVEGPKQRHLAATYENGTAVTSSLLSQRDIIQLASARPTIRVSSKGVNVTGQLAIPQACLTRTSRAEDTHFGDEGTSGTAPKVTINHVPELGCNHNGHVYDDGDSWRPSDDGPAEAECSTCSCKRNQVQCHKELCPSLTCPDPVRVPGECCLACNGSSVGAGSYLSSVPALVPGHKCFFPGDKRYHTVGTLWHPYIHPVGYFSCAVCYCAADGAGYDCKQIVCPPLPCPEHIAERKSEKDCCKVCPARTWQSSSVMPSPLAGAGLMPSDDAAAESCASGSVGGGRVASSERMQKKPGTSAGLECLLCTCKDGSTSCTKVKCNCRRQSAGIGHSECCQKLCTLTLHGPAARGATERKLRRLAASLPLRGGGGVS